MTDKSFYWYDYETFGTRPALDRPAQFAGVRTDMELNPIGAELLIYNRLSDDYLPDPAAALVTGIGPSTVQQQGLAECEFIARIQQEISQPGTCNTGYNSIRFDDEFTRFTLFRNFHDAYEHEWRNGNSRWDLLDVVRLTRALRPEGIQWPFHPDGSASNRLEDITRVNGLSHAQAHDALSDVYATIAVARLIRERQPRLFQYAFSQRDKASVAAALNLRDQTPVVHVSGMIPGCYGHTAIVLPLLRHPVNKNGVVVLDLREDPAELESMSSTELARRIFTPSSELGESETRVAIKTIHTNRAPVVVPLSTLHDEAARRLQIDKSRSLRHRDKVLGFSSLPQRIAEALQSHSFAAPGNVDASLYGGGFFSTADKNRFARIRQASATELASLDESWDDERVEEMLFRYRARNYPQSLNAAEQQRWAEHCIATLGSVSGESAEHSVLQQYWRKLSPEQWPSGNEELHRDLLQYGQRLAAQWSLSVDQE